MAEPLRQGHGRRVHRGAPATSGPERDSAPAPTWFPTPFDHLELSEIPSESHFVRDHFPVPEIDPATWALRIDGLRTLALTAQELRSRRSQTLRVVLECAGHRRKEFDPIPTGLPWGCGAVAEAQWTGAGLAEVLLEAGVPDGSREVVIEGADAGEVAGVPGVHRFARSLPLEKALSGEVLLAWAINGEPIPARRGGPVRLIVPDWYATDSIKWPARIWFAATPFQGYFEASDYRFRRPGDPAPGERMTDLPVNSLIISPRAGQAVSSVDCPIRGIAWGGAGGVAGVEVQIDAGDWRPARITGARERYARTFWELSCEISPGAHNVTSRATDRAGNVQPGEPTPNVRGYGNNAVHRIEVSIVRSSATRARR